MDHHDIICGPLLMLMTKHSLLGLIQNIPVVHVLIHLFFFAGVIPSFVGEDYYGETGSRNEAEQCYYFDDPLWDDEGCEGENECCDRGGLWFYKQLPQPTQDDIEMRVCTNTIQSNEDIVLEQIEIFVQ